AGGPPRARSDWSAGTREPARHPGRCSFRRTFRCGRWTGRIRSRFHRVAYPVRLARLARESSPDARQTGPRLAVPSGGGGAAQPPARAPGSGNSSDLPTPAWQSEGLQYVSIGWQSPESTSWTIETPTRPTGVVCCTHISPPFQVAG